MEGKVSNQPRVIVTRPIYGICHMQVCAVNDARDEELLEIANRENPSGTSLGWAAVVREPENCAPKPCADQPTERTHYLLVC